MRFYISGIHALKDTWYEPFGEVWALGPGRNFTAKVLRPVCVSIQVVFRCLVEGTATAHLRRRQHDELQFAGRALRAAINEGASVTVYNMR